MFLKYHQDVFILFLLISVSVVHCYSQVRKQSDVVTIQNEAIPTVKNNNQSKAEDAFLGVYSDCIWHLSYTCIQKKTLMYLNKLNNQREFPILGSFLSFGKPSSFYCFTHSHKIFPTVFMRIFFFSENGKHIY